MKLIENFLVEGTLIPVEIYEDGDKFRLSVNNQFIDQEFNTHAEARQYGDSYKLLVE